MPHDLLSSSANTSMLSSVIRVKLWDPKNQAELSPPDLSSGMTIKINGKPTNNTYLVNE